MFSKRFLILSLMAAASMVLTACPATSTPAAQAPAAEAPAAEATEAPAAEAPAAADEACAPASEGEFAGVDPRGQTIVWWHQHSGSRADKLVEMITEYNSSNECGITVDAQAQGDYNAIRDKVNASIGAGEQPAALLVGYQNDQAFYQLNDTLADFDTFINDPAWGLSAEERADFYPSFFDQPVHPLFDNKRLGFPPNRSMEVLFYNETWMKELGFDAPPTTPEEFKTIACAAAAANGDGTGGYILRDDASALASWTYAFGGDILSDDGTSYVFNSDATIQALEFLKSLYDEKCAYFFTEGFPNPEFAARRAIFAQGSSSGIPFYLGDMKTVAEEQKREVDTLGVTAIPHTTENPVQNVYGGDVMITNVAPEQQLAAWIFVKWFTSPEIQARWVEASNYFPTRASTNEFLGDYVSKNPQWGQAAELLPFAYYEPQLISYQAARDGATKAFNEIMQGADIQATLDALTTSANEQQEAMMKEIQ